MGLKAAQTVIVAAVAVLVAAVSLSAQEPAKKPAPAASVDWWRGSFKEAKAAAVARNVPILVFIVQDDEESNDALSREVLTTPEFVRLSERGIVILASRAEHGGVATTVAGKTEKLCKRYRTLACAEHQHLEAEIYATYFKGEPVKTPHVKALYPDGKIGESFEDVTSLSVFSTALTKVAKALGAGIGRSEWKRVQDDLKNADIAKSRGNPGRAFLLTDRIATDYPKAGIAKTADAARKAVKADVTTETEALAAALKTDEDPLAIWARAERLRLSVMDAPALTTPLDPILNTLRTGPKKKEIADLQRKENALLPLLKNARAADDIDDLVTAGKAYRAIALKGAGLPIKALADERLRTLADSGADK